MASVGLVGVSTQTERGALGPVARERVEVGEVGDGPLDP